MNKITFLGAGSSVFAKNVLGDCMMTKTMQDWEYALFDIDPQRLEESFKMLSIINRNCNEGRAKIVKYKLTEKRHAEIMEELKARKAEK